MKLAFSKPTRTDEQTQALLSNFRGVGFDGLQLKASQYAAYLDDAARFKHEHAQWPGAASALICAGHLETGRVLHLRRTIKFAGEVGADLVVFCLVMSRENLADGDLHSFARVLSEAGLDAMAAGTKLSVHHHFGHPVMHRHELDTFFDAIQDGAVGLTVDTAHLVKSGIHDVAGLIRDMAAVIDNFHLKDYADGEWQVLGRGGIDFEPVFAAIQDIGYDGWVSADEESGSEVVEGMTECYEFMRGGLGR